MPKKKNDGSLQSSTESESDAPFSVFRAAGDIEGRKDMYDQLDKQLQEQEMTEDEKRANKLFDF